MDTIGQEFLLPAILPSELWEESGRWTGMGDNMFRLKDRKGAELCLGMTHEEVMTSIARNELRTYKQLPQIWYQIQTKFRDEPRPKAGLLRVRQFLMKDAYSFDIDEAGLDQSYHKHDRVYRRIFNRCGLEFVAVEADSGAMGGSQSQEFMVYTEAGEDLIARSASGYAANLEKATSVLAPSKTSPRPATASPSSSTPPASAPSPTSAPSSASTPRRTSSAWPSWAPGPPPAPMPSPLRPVVAFLRGDHHVNETKLNAVAGTAELRPMLPEELELYIGGPAGFLGPVGIPEVMTGGSLNGLNSGKALDKLKGVLRDNPAEGLKTIVILDLGLEGRTNLVAGANKLDYHFRNVTPGRDFTPTLIADIRNIHEGELDPIGQQPLRLGKAVEIGHIFKLGYKYTEMPWAPPSSTATARRSPPSWAATASASSASSPPPSNPPPPAAPVSTRQGKGDQTSYALPPSIAPFQVVVTITNIGDRPSSTPAKRSPPTSAAAGIDILLDDRDERAGVKFKDAELIGIPYRINIGKKLAEGNVELVDRLQNQTVDLPVDGVTSALRALLANVHKLPATPR